MLSVFMTPWISHSHPVGDQVSLLIDGRLEQNKGLVFLVLDFGEMPVDQVVEEGLSDGDVLMEGCVLEGAHPDVRAGDAVRIAPGNSFPGRPFPRLSRRRSCSVVGMPRVCVASLTAVFLSIGPKAARPSPPLE